MQKFNPYFVAFASLSLLITSVVPVLPAAAMPTASEVVEAISEPLEIKEAQAAQGGPTAFQLMTRDEGCSSQQSYSSSVGYPGATGTSSAYVTDGNGKDPDCLSITMSPGNTSIVSGSMYTSDFRLGIRLSESEYGCTRDSGPISWTQWASEGGGTAYVNAAAGVEDADCTWLYYETRALSGSVRIQDARVGISAGWGSAQYTPWASQGGGQSATSVASGGGFTTARLTLETSLNYKYNAAYTSTTIPQTPSTLTPNVQVSSNIVMRNIPDVGATTARPWTSDQTISSTTNRGTSTCYEWTPTAEGQSCTQTTVYSSSKFKLRRIDSNTTQVETTSGDLAYRRTVTTQFTSVPIYEEYCYEGYHDPEDPGGPPGDGPELPLEPETLNDSGDSKIKRFAENLFGIKTAKATHIECSQTGNVIGYAPSWQSQNQTPDVLHNETAQFDLNVTGRVNGTYQLQFQMVRTDNNELFGDPNASGNSNTIARINVTVGAAWTVSCGSETSVVPNGTTQFTIAAYGASSPITVTMTPNPAGPTMTNSPLVLNSSNSYTGLAQISAAGLSDGLYVLTFSYTDGVNPAQTCPVNLRVQSPPPTVDLDFNGQDGPVTLSNNATSGTLSWTSSYATNCTASTTPSANTITPAWNGAITPVASGSSAISNMNYSTAYTFTLSCTGPGGTRSDSVVVSSTPQNPTVEMKCTPALDNCSGTWGTYASLWWSSTNATSCSISDNNPNLADYGSAGTQRNQSTPLLLGPLQQSTTFTIICQGVAGTTPDDDAVTYTITANPDYTLSRDPISGTVSQGNTIRTYLDVSNPVQGFNSNVTISVVSICSTSTSQCVAAGSLPGIITLSNATQASPYSTDTEAAINSGNLAIDSYIVTFRATAASGTPAPKTTTYALTVNPPAVLNPPTNVQGFNNVCGQITITWSAPAGPAPTSYSIYRRTASGTFGSPIATGITALTYTNSLATDPTLNTTDLYYYGVSAVYGTAQSTIAATASALSVTACNASFNGSYKKIVGAGTSTPTFSRCSGSGGGYTLPTGQIFQSGDNVFFEICVRNGGTLNLTSVSVTEVLAQDRSLENVQFVNANGNCATGSGSGPYTIGSMTPGQVCSILVKATISNPGGPTSSLHYFVNYAQLTSAEVSATVNTLPEPFVIGSDVPDRQEIPR